MGGRPGMAISQRRPDLGFTVEELLASLKLD
jgi:hypothetical protein